MTVLQSDITINVDGSSMPAYIARPDPASGPHSAVIVLQEIYGVNKEMKRITDLVASVGYVGLALNYYHRADPAHFQPYTEQGTERGFEVAATVSRKTLREDVAAAIDFLNCQDYVKKSKIATWGFCFGGTVAFLTATLPGLAAAVCFYGGNIAQPLPVGEPEALADAKDIQCPLLLVYGEDDPYISAQDVARTNRALAEAGKRFQIQEYPGVGHAFFRESSEHMHSAVVADAWDLVQAFLKRVFA
ncbi:MAG: dienelactone hydrolase family protein [Candidatus Eremiobacteraeota bacterium]|nr:dienelactone hydrolase family protein [Candidatus Eremiobacteraeota bacterium]